MEKYNVAEASEAQRRYCDARGIPMFAPADGWCHVCGRNIYHAVTYRGREDHPYGISVETAGRRLISGCPHCNATFVD